jgi:hypothetical protein
MSNTIQNNPIVTIPIHINGSKSDDMQPDLLGSFDFKGRPLRIPIWTRRTRDGSRTYHSFSISEPYVKGGPKTAPLVKGQKLYEFDGAEEGSPDYQGPESFTLLGETVWGALWTELEPEEDAEVTFRMELLHSPFRAKLTTNAADTLEDIRNRKLERRKERELAELQAARDMESLHEDLNMDPEPEAPY